MGTKKEVLATAVPHYEKDRILMIGDAPGDQSAAKAHGARFFPVVPGDEENSWTRLLDEGIDRFLNGTYAGAYEEKLTAEFLAKLPSVPPWKR
jgi:phosphoglycolate phosphatase-like HAD superfamily hydrolase